MARGYVEALDNIDNVSKSELEDFELYVTKATDILDVAMDHCYSTRSLTLLQVHDDYNQYELSRRTN